MKLVLGIKSDPVEYRYSYDWLLRVLREEGVKRLQLGTFFEIYQLPDEWFRELRLKAADSGVEISSVFTAHRELGGFFRAEEPGWECVARRNFERLIEIAALLGARTVGSNPGAVMRDAMNRKRFGIETYLRHFHELQHVAGERGIEWLTMEPMSCLAEPPTLPAELRDFMREVRASDPGERCARAGYCLDVSHGYADVSGQVIASPLELMEAALPYTCEIHLKNTDSAFDKTFGFLPEERKCGIVDIPALRAWLMERADLLPVSELNGYLEIGGPKLGRDYSDVRLEDQLRGSLQYLREEFATEDAPAPADFPVHLTADAPPDAAVWIEPSMMCADLCNLDFEVRTIEALGVQALHLDIMDAHFVPNMPLGLEFIGELRKRTSVALDVHLMVDDPAFYVPKLAESGVDYISIHAESTPHVDRVLALIRDHGARAGLALNPATPLSALDYVLERLDYVLLMTVNPGFAGQRLVPSALRKIADCRRMLADSGFHLPIQVDGNVSFEHIPSMVAAGADWLVAGTSSLFHRGATRVENVRRMRRCIREGLARRAPCAPRARKEAMAI